jgi:hypothetical protein
MKAGMKQNQSAPLPAFMASLFVFCVSGDMASTGAIRAGKAFVIAAV